MIDLASSNAIACLGKGLRCATLLSVPRMEQQRRYIRTIGQAEGPECLCLPRSHSRGPAAPARPRPLYPQTIAVNRAAVSRGLTQD